MPSKRYLRRDAGLLDTKTGRKGCPETLVLACGATELVGVFESIEVMISAGIEPFESSASLR